METLIDLFELQEPIVETYRAPTPPESIDLAANDNDSGIRLAPRIERGLRARLWATED